MRATLLAIAAITAALPTQAAEPYLDDRSTPSSLVESLYNAINRKEFSRAWSYFAEPPAKTLDEYAEGYADTANVTVRTGPASEEGAAGSTYYNLPVAIEAMPHDGDPQVFAGCYELRLANPQIQGEDFRPLHIVKGRLKPSSEPLDQAMPAGCGDGPPPPVDTMLERATKMFRAALDRTCLSIEDPDPATRAPESYEIGFRYKYDGPTDPERAARLFRFPCNRGAYNESHVYLMARDYGELHVLGFATPELDIRYSNDDREGAVDAVYVTGFQSVTELVNSDFDPDTMTLASFAKWRGVGDASSSGTWAFRDGDFALVKYEVDASYDGEMNPQTVVDYQTGP